MDLRSTGHLNAGNAVLETIRPQARDILIAHLHLTTFKVWAFKEANLVVLRILQHIKSRIRARISPVRVAVGSVQSGFRHLVQTNWEPLNKYPNFPSGLPTFP